MQAFFYAFLIVVAIILGVIVVGCFLWIIERLDSLESPIFPIGIGLFCAFLMAICIGVVNSIH